MIKASEIKEKIGKSLYLKLKKDKLTNKEIAFTAEYLTNRHNGTQAYLEVIALPGTKTSTANVECMRYLNKPKIQAALQYVFDRWLGEKKNKLNKEIIDILYKRAFYDINIFQKADGSWKDLDNIPRQWRCCIDGKDVKFYGKDANKSVTTLKLANRDVSLDKLERYVGLIKPDSEVNKNVMTDETIKLLKDVFEKGGKK